MKTQPLKASEIKREWHLVDVKGEVLGRISTHIAKLLMGKEKTYFIRRMDCGDYVVVINAKEINLTGKKEKNKNYYRHSGYPEGMKIETAEVVRKNHPERLIMHAVSGMLPDNRLKDKMLARLFIFPGEEHTYSNKFKDKQSFSTSQK